MGFPIFFPVAIRKLAFGAVLLKCAITTTAYVMADSKNPKFTDISQVSGSDGNLNKSPEHQPTPAKMKKEESNKNDSPKFPDDLEGFGFEFNAEGRLHNIADGQPFVFNESSEHSHNQKRYEALGEAVTKHIYKLLETECNLKRSFIPVDRKNLEPQTFIFLSDDALTNPDKLLIFIHGSGVVRAGQWARRLIINDRLETGTQIPYILRAQEEGYGVMVLNSNDNYSLKDGKRVEIRGSESPEHHVKYCWEHYVSMAKARHVGIIAHSYGGVCAVDLANHHIESMIKRVFAIAMTDSVHMMDYQIKDKSTIAWLQKVSRNWVGSSDPLDTPVHSFRKHDIHRVSAGDKQHEMTSWSSFVSVFRFLAKRYEYVHSPEVQSSKTEL